MEEIQHNNKHNKRMFITFISVLGTLCVVMICISKMMFPCSFVDKTPIAKCECKYKYSLDLTVEKDFLNDENYDKIKTTIIFNQLDTFNGLALMLYDSNPEYYRKIEYEIDYLRQQTLINLKFLSNKISYQQWEEDLNYLSSIEMIRLDETSQNQE